MTSGADEMFSGTECGVRVTFERQARIRNVDGRQIHVPDVVHLTKEKEICFRIRELASLIWRLERGSPFFL